MTQTEAPLHYSSEKAVRGLSPILKQLPALLGLVALCIALSIARPATFPTPGNLLTVLVQFSVNAVLAIGITPVIITAGIDLSIGSILALSAVCMAVTMRGHPIGGAADIGLGVACGLAVGLAYGIINGLVIALSGLPPFIVTLGTMSMGRGAALLITGGLEVAGLPPKFTSVWQGSGIPNVTVMLIVGLVMHIMLSRTALGRRAYAIGGNAQAARLSGIPIVKSLVSVYGLCGLCAGIAAMLTVGREASTRGTVGLGYELDAIAAAVIGGTSLMGGEGSIVGTIIGAATMGVLRNGLVLLGVSDNNQKILIGAVVIAAVLVDKLRRR
ncbi:MAG: ABC transporter permease [Armatimonadota bacterium]